MTRSRPTPVAAPRRGVGRLAGLVAGLALVAAGCGPSAVSLEELSFDQEAYDGDEVTVRGVVVEFDEDDGAIERHFVLQDDAQNRVELVPGEAAEPYVGSTVEVTGEFTVEQGRRLHVDDIGAPGE